MSALDPLEIPLDRRCLVEASAGTGKTFTIALLYVRLVMERGLAANEILVVTYTRAAAAELRERIRNRLQEMERALEARLQSDTPVDRGPHSKVLSMVEASMARGRPHEELKDLQQALRSFDESMISTIHGFCQRMLDENAFESGAAFGTELVAHQGALVEQVVADYWTRNLYSAEPEFIRWLRANTKGGERIGPRLLGGLAEMATRYPRIAIHPTEVKEVEFDWAAHAQAFERVAQLWAERGPAALRKL
ncbi:UvrD-helicase domain-containing protein, partial [Myxococcota bacterium]|nr:UvrD-helicase domain-containing protein [Myxococcota bacterium]